MRFEPPQPYLIVPSPSWPFNDDAYDPLAIDYQEEQFSGYLSWGRRITNLSYSDSDPEHGAPTTDQYSYLSFCESGKTQRICGDRYLPGTVVLCQWINGRLFAICDCFVAMPLQLREGNELDLPDGSTSFEEAITLYTSIEQRISPYDYLPYTVELITTGDHKDELDGLYALLSYFPRLQKKRIRKNFGCVGPRLNGKAGAAMTMELEGVVYDGVVVTNKTLTVSHESITTTVYTGHGDQLEKVSGDATLPNDLYYRFTLTGNAPLWFELATGSSLPIDGLYTLWPDYWEDVTNAGYAPSKGYLHRPDGSRQAASYSLGYDAGTQQFTISATVAGDSFAYVCSRADFSFANGSRMYFTLQTDLSTDPGRLPATLAVLRPSNGYNRTVRLEDQL